jgi:phosphoglucosamine mutase
VVISASHNPYDEAGIKIFGKDGFKLDEALETEIETLVDKELAFTSNYVGKISDFPNAIPTYIRFLLSTVNKDFSCKGMKIIIDCANGAVYKVAERLFNNLQAEVVFMNAKPNGFNINKDCGALYPEGLRKAVIENNADLGLAFDGDGDRLILIDKKGNIRDGDDILYISAKYLKEKNRLKNNKIVATIMSNLALELKLKDLDIEVIRCPVGDRFVAEAMCREDTILGGESSGHIIFFEYNITGDGLLSALQVLKIMHKTNKDLHILCDDFKKFPQVLLNIPVRQKRQIEELPKTYEIVKEFKKIYKSNLRIIVRPSGTENLMRVMVEGDDMTKIKKIAEDIASAITEDDKNNK